MICILLLKVSWTPSVRLRSSDSLSTQQAAFRSKGGITVCKTLGWFLWTLDVPKLNPKSSPTGKGQTSAYSWQQYRWQVTHHNPTTFLSAELPAGLLNPAWPAPARALPARPPEGFGNQHGPRIISKEQDGQWGCLALEANSNCMIVHCSMPAASHTRKLYNALIY